MCNQVAKLADWFFKVCTLTPYLKHIHWHENYATTNSVGKIQKSVDHSFRNQIICATDFIQGVSLYSLPFNFLF